MSASRILLVVVALVGTCTTLLHAQEVREWTDTRGQTMTAKLLMVTPDDKVVLESDGQTYFIPLDRFSEKDQEYVQAQKNAEPSDSDEEPTEETPTRRPSKDDELFDNRQWTDSQGMQIRAKYLRMHEGHAIIKQGAKVHKVSFYDLSEADQAYLREKLAARGEEDQILSQAEMLAINQVDANGRPIPGASSVRPPRPSARSGSSGSSTTPSSDSSEPAYKPPAGAPYVPPSSQPAFDPSQITEQNGEQPSERQPLFMPPDEGGFGGSTDASTADNGSEQSETETVAANLPNQNATQTERGGNAGFSNRFSSGTVSDVPAGHCPNCRNELPRGIGPGDHCPKCKMFLGPDTTPGTGAPETPWYLSFNYGTIGGLVIVALALLNFATRNFRQA